MSTHVNPWLVAQTLRWKRWSDAEPRQDYWEEGASRSCECAMTMPLEDGCGGSEGRDRGQRWSPVSQPTLEEGRMAVTNALRREADSSRGTGDSGIVQHPLRKAAEVVVETIANALGVVEERWSWAAEERLGAVRPSSREGLGVSRRVLVGGGAVPSALRTTGPLSAGVDSLGCARHVRLQLSCAACVGAFAGRALSWVCLMLCIPPAGVSVVCVGTFRLVRAGPPLGWARLEGLPSPQLGLRFGGARIVRLLASKATCVKCLRWACLDSGSA